jgi:hypothetical protein
MPYKDSAKEKGYYKEYLNENNGVINNASR